MAVQGGLLTRKALLLAKIESTPGTDALPVPSLDAIQVIDPDFALDPNVLEREIVSPDLSPHEHVIGRKLTTMTFTVECKSNGSAQSGDLSADEPRLARLLRGCGYELLDASGSVDFAGDTDVDPATDEIIVTNHRFQNGDGPVQVTTSGTLPTGLTIDTDYWVIVNDEDTIELAATKADADAGTPVDITVDGTGTSTLENLNQMARVVADPDNDATASVVTWTNGTFLEANRPPDGITVQSPVLYIVEVTTGGASGVAQVTITNNNTAEDDLSSPTPETITADTPLELGGSGATVTADWTGNLVLGDIWRVMVYPPGIRAVPRSSGFECLTIYFYEDGLRYRSLANQGTFTVDATAGNFGTFEFTFTGQYTAPTDVALPTDEVFETPLPQQVELALLTWGSNVTLVAEQWTIDQANNVVPRPDVNMTDGFAGTRISGRNPAGSFNPEATLVATEDFWGDFANAKAKTFTARVGTSVGNQVVFFGPKAQTSDISLGDRDDIRVFEQDIAFRRATGDDELEIHFA